MSGLIFVEQASSPNTPSANRVAFYAKADGLVYTKDDQGTERELQTGTPVGTLSPYAGSTEPAGWLFCYGQAISRTTYAPLFAIIGTTYGAGDGSTTFNVPDIRGRVIAGQDDMGGTSANRLTNQSGGLDGDVLGATGGSETHTLTIAQLASHTHDIQTLRGNAVGSGGTYPDGNSVAGETLTSDATGGDAAHNNVQPTIILNYIIKT